MLKAEHVYVDTEQWRGIRLDWANDLAQALLSACVQKRVYLKTTDILLGELRASIRRGVDDYVEALRRTERNRSIAFGEVVGGVDPTTDFEFLKERLELELRNGMGNYFQKCNAKNIRHRDAVIDVVLHRYFSGQAPFAGTKDKKHEFPDALALDTLENWCRLNREMMYVVSQDKGVRSYCEASDHLIHTETLASFIRELNEGTAESDLMTQLLLQSKDGIAEQIEKTVEDMRVRFEDGAEEVASVTSAKIHVRKADLILKPSNNEYVAYVSVVGALEVAASGDDPNLWIRDQKTGRLQYLYKEERRYRVELEAAFRVGLWIEGQELTIDYVQPMNGDLIQISRGWLEGETNEIVRAHLADLHQDDDEWL